MNAPPSVDRQQAVARESIRHAVMSYAVAGDRGDVDELAAQFTEDGVLEVRAPGGTEFATGRAGIVDLLGTHMARGGANPPGFFLRHNITTQVVQSLTDDSATGVAYFTVFGPRGPDHWGRYRDRYVLDADRWFIAHRTVRVDAHSEASWYERVFLTGQGQPTAIA